MTDAEKIKRITETIETKRRGQVKQVLSDWKLLDDKLTQNDVDAIIDGLIDAVQSIVG